MASKFDVTSLCLPFSNIVSDYGSVGVPYLYAAANLQGCANDESEQRAIFREICEIQGSQAVGMDQRDVMRSFPYSTFEDVLQPALSNWWTLEKQFFNTMGMRGDWTSDPYRASNRTNAFVLWLLSSKHVPNQDYLYRHMLPLMASYF